MKVEMELPDLPDGYEYTGEFQQTVHGTMYLNSKNRVSVKTDKTTSLSKFPIVRFSGHPWINEPAIPAEFIDHALKLYVTDKWKNV